MTLLLTLAAFLCGSLMFSYWLGAWLRHDLRKVGDGNPGAYNLWKAAGYRWGLAGVVLDFSKGFVPVWLILESGLAEGAAIVPIAAAPIAGHAFSPFLHGKGGKALAVTFGVWSALTRFEASFLYGLILAVFFAVTRIRGQTSAVKDGFFAVVGMLPVAAYLAAFGQPAHHLWIWLINVSILAYAHRRELAAVLGRPLGRR